MDEVFPQLRIHGGKKGEPFLVNVQFLPHCLFYASLGMRDGRGEPQLSVGGASHRDSVLRLMRVRGAADPVRNLFSEGLL